MEKEKLMDLLRHPKGQQKTAVAPQPGVSAQQAAARAAARKASDKRAAIIAGVVTALVLVSLLFIFSAQKRAGNITASLDPSVLKGLVVDRTFNPSSEPRYVQVGEGQDRNVTVVESGSTLPVISRYNYLALTPNNYKVIGAAPWALSINVSSNAEDPQLLRYLFNRPEVTEAFLARPDVAPLLADPAALARLAQDPKAVADFLADETVQQVLASPQLLQALAGSRLFSSLLVSKAVKYYRDHPAQAARLIHANTALAALKRNPAVRQEVARNHYLKNISATLLK